MEQKVLDLENANQAVLKSMSYAYVGRKDKKSDFRKLWITRTKCSCKDKMEQHTVN